MLQQEYEAQTSQNIDAQGLLAGESSYNLVALKLWSDITQLNAVPGFMTNLWPLAMYVCNSKRLSPQPGQNILVRYVILSQTYAPRLF